MSEQETTTEVTLYNQQWLTHVKETPGTHVYATDVNGRKQSQYVPKADVADKKNRIRVKIEFE